MAGPEDFEPSSEKMQVIGAFNPGVTTVEKDGIDKTLLMVRVAESPVEESQDKFLFPETRKYPVADPKRVLMPYFDTKNSDDSPFCIEFDAAERREIDMLTNKDVRLKNGVTRLRHVSHQKIVTSSDGRTIDHDDDKRVFYPKWEHEKFGIEDCRITRMGNDYYITYPSPHREYNVSTSVARTKDFRQIERLPIGDNPMHIFTGMKDVAIFPELFGVTKKDGRYMPNQFAALTRNSAFANVSKPGIWVSFSPDPCMEYWGGDRRIIFTQNGEITGTGPAMQRIEDKDGPMWFAPYHIIHESFDGPTRKNVYDEALFATDYEKPWVLKYKSPILIEHGEFDLPDSFIPDVCYTTGMVIDDGIVRMYSGENDAYVSVREFYLSDLVDFMKGRERTMVTVSDDIGENALV